MTGIKKMKRVFITLLLLILVVSCMIGCNSDTEKQTSESSNLETVSQNEISTVTSEKDEDEAENEENKLEYIWEQINFDIPEDFVECKKYIGEDISVFVADDKYWANVPNSFNIGKSSLYGNSGTVRVSLGWDKRTIINVSLSLDEGEYINGSEYDDISRKIELIFGEDKTVILDGITDFSGIGDTDFRLLRNGAGIGWNKEHQDAFDRLKPKDEIQHQNDVPDIKFPPAIGMTAEEIRESTWGEPSDINKTTTRYGVSEQWVYRSYSKTKYIYFDDGVVTSIQE